MLFVLKREEPFYCIIKVMIKLSNTDACVLPGSVNLNEFQGKENNVVCIAPHPDDDALGVGGSLKMHAENEDNVFTVFVTSGSGSPATGGKRTPASLAALRQEEAVKSMRIYGALAGIFLGYEATDAREVKTEEVTQDIFRVLIALKPARIYVPSPFEKHPTHIACLQRTLEAIYRVPGFVPELRGYGVWGDIFAAESELEIVDITDVIDVKKRACRAHESQCKNTTRDVAMAGYNHYIASYNDPLVAVEGTRYSEKLLIMNEIVSRPELGVDVYARNLALKHLHDLYQGDN